MNATQPPSSSSDWVHRLSDRCEPDEQGREHHHGRANTEAEASTEPHRRGRHRRRPRPRRQGEKLKAELDDLLDEIDEVLETNAEDFVKSYVQKGGE